MTGYWGKIYAPPSSTTQRKDSWYECIYLTITEGFEKLTAGYRALENDGLLYTLVALMVIDYITELMITVIDKSTSRNIGFKGFFKKVLILCFVGIGQMVDLHIIIFLYFA